MMTGQAHLAVQHISILATHVCAARQVHAQGAPRRQGGRIGRDQDAYPSPAHRLQPEHGYDADNTSFYLLLKADTGQKSSRESFVSIVWAWLMSYQAGKHWHLTSACMSQVHDLAAM